MRRKLFIGSLAVMLLLAVPCLGQAAEAKQGKAETQLTPSADGALQGDLSQWGKVVQVRTEAQTGGQAQGGTSVNANIPSDGKPTGKRDPNGRHLPAEITAGKVIYDTLTGLGWHGFKTPNWTQFDERAAVYLELLINKPHLLKKYGLGETFGGLDVENEALKRAVQDQEAKDHLRTTNLQDVLAQLQKFRDDPASFMGKNTGVTEASGKVILTYYEEAKKEPSTYVYVDANKKDIYDRVWDGILILCAILGIIAVLFALAYFFRRLLRIFGIHTMPDNVGDLQNNVRDLEADLKVMMAERDKYKKLYEDSEQNLNKALVREADEKAKKEAAEDLATEYRMLHNDERDVRIALQNGLDKVKTGMAEADKLYNGILAEFGHLVKKR